MDFGRLLLELIEEGTDWVFAVVVCRSQMQTIITKACKELGTKPIPSKRVSVALPLDKIFNATAISYHWADVVSWTNHMLHH